jgi:RNA polymerase sigma-70 factor (ECF subfamily)
MTFDRDSSRGHGGGPADVADPRVFAAQYRDAYHRLTLVAAAVTGDRESAEDIVQEASIIAFGKAGEFTPGTNFAAWLAEIVRRCALNHRRKVHQRRTFSADPAVLGQMNHVASPIEPSPIAVESGRLLADQTAFDDELSLALESLGEQARACLLLRVVEKLSYAEISELLNIPEGTAMSHVHRSKAALRKRLSHEEESA